MSVLAMARLETMNPGVGYICLDVGAKDVKGRQYCVLQRGREGGLRRLNGTRNLTHFRLGPPRGAGEDFPENPFLKKKAPNDNQC